MSATRVTVDSRDFDRAAQRLVATSKKSAREVLTDQARLVVVEAAKITPPNKNFKWNRKGGETTVRTDLARLFASSTAASAETGLGSIHRAERNRFGRVPRGVQQRRARGLAAYRKQVLATVGLMAAGWKAAASKLGAKLPAWITRHNSAGFATVDVRGSRVAITIANASVYPRLAASLDRRLSAVLKRRTDALTRRWDYFVKVNARAAGFNLAVLCLLPAAN
jgi:hypothetical protein